jgi:hypothetical protein
MNAEKPIEYELFNGECTAFVDYTLKRVVVDERGGWGRRYDMCFEDLAKKATRWQMTFDSASPEAEMADTGARLIMGENRISHGLSAEPYIKMPTTLSPGDKQVIKAFERLIQTHGANLVTLSLSSTALDALLKCCGAEGSDSD